MDHNKKRLCIISLLVMGLFFCCSMEQVNAKNKVVSPKIIKKIYQKVEYDYNDDKGNKRTSTVVEPISCGIDNCDQHSKGHITEGLRQGKTIKEIVKCRTASNLYMIKVPINTIENKKIKKNYMTLKELNFYSMQGSCCNGKDIYVAFSDKGNSKNTKEIGAVTGLEALNLTAVVKLSLTGDGYEVAQVMVIKGFENMDDAINYMGHANDMTYANGKLQTTWYEVKKGKKGQKRFTLGYIDVDDVVKGMATNIGNSIDSKNKTVFGVAKYKNDSNRLAVGIREKKQGVKRYVDLYKYIKKNKSDIKYQYVRKKRLFNIKPTKINKQKYSITQCMESDKKYIFVNQFYESEKSNNNCIQIYKNNKYKKALVIKDPEILLPGEKKEISLAYKRWELEGFGKLKKDNYYCLMAMPHKDEKAKTVGKSRIKITTKLAYLCTLKIK